MQLIQKQGPQKIDFRADGTCESHPTAWELRCRKNILKIVIRSLPKKRQKIIYFRWHYEGNYFIKPQVLLIFIIIKSQKVCDAFKSGN